MDLIVTLVGEFIAFIGETIEFIADSWPDQFFRIFWALVLFEVPRYLLSDFWVLFIYLRELGEPKDTSIPDRFPKLSVVLPALNEEDIIARTVDSLYEQEYPNLEIVIVDDGSTDRTPQICRRLADERKIKYFRYENRQGKSAALNYGVRASSGEYIIFGDTDSTYDRGSFTNILSYFADPNVGAVGGNLGVRNWRRNLLTRFQMIEFLVSFTVGRKFKAEAGILSIVPGAFGAFRRDLVERVGGHEPGPGNDSDLTIRVRKLGKKVAFAPDATSLTDCPFKWKGWMKQRLRWDRNIIRNRVRKHRNIFDVTSRNFSWSTFFSFADVLFFTIGLSLLWFIYTVDMAMNYDEVAVTVLFANYLMHLANKIFQLCIALLVVERRAEYAALLLYTPLFALYRVAIRLVRLTATFQELVLRSSYRDSFAPEHVQKEMEVY